MNLFKGRHFKYDIIIWAVGGTVSMESAIEI